MYLFIDFLMIFYNNFVLNVHVGYFVCGVTVISNGFFKVRIDYV